MTALALCVSTFAVCLASAVFPIVHAELYLISVSAVSPSRLVLPLILAATAGQILGKVIMYFCGRGVVHLPGGRIKQKLAEVERRFSDRKGLSGLLVFVSASTGLPPFFLVTIASGMFRVPLRHFLICGGCGRLLRFAVVVMSPQAVKVLWPGG